MDFFFPWNNVRSQNFRDGYSPVAHFIFVKLQAKSLDQELTLFYPCHKKNKKKNKKNKKKKKKNPHQNLSEGGVLEG